ncbi:MAG: hypothetical protein GKR93_05975 [Gammaproteobacteria bacterium]|nr:hypothetical protein [Gammaproteobacteria bacterium]
MKTSASLTIAVVVLAALLIFYGYWISPPAGDNKIVTEPGQDLPIATKGISVPLPNEKEDVELDRRQKMEKAYSELVQARRALKSKANLLKSLSWGIKLPSAEAKQISHSMREVFVYLKNPPMLGAYYDLAEINRELRKIDSMKTGLEGAELILESKRATEISTE